VVRLWICLAVSAGLFSCSAERLARKAYRKDPGIFDVIYRPVEFTLKMKLDTLEKARYLSRLDTFFLDKNWPDTIRQQVIREIPRIVTEIEQIPMNSDTISKVWPDSSWVQGWVYQGELHIEGDLASITVDRPETFWEKLAKYSLGFGVGVLAIVLFGIFLKVRL